MQNINFLPIIGIEELSVLLKRSKEVIKRDRCDPVRKYTLPHAYRPEGTKNPLWVTEDVIAWLREHPEEPTSSAKKKLGAPTKAQRILKRERQVHAATNQSNQ